MTRFWR